MKVLKRFTALFCALALALSLAACGSSDVSQSATEEASSSQTEAESDQDYSGSTVTGQVTAIDGATVTLQLGELTESEGFGGGEMPNGEGGGEMPSGDADGSGTTPEMPDGEMPSGDADGSGTVPEMPDGEMPSGDFDGSGTVPEMPDGEMPSGDFDGSGTTPEMPDGESGDFDGEMPDGSFGGAGSFTAGEDTLEVDLTDVTISLSDGSEGSASDLAVDDILQITFDEDGAISSVTVVTVTGGEGGGVVSEAGSNFGGSSEVDQGTAATTLDADGDYSGETYTSTGDDENALRVDGAAVTLDGITVDKSAGSSSDAETGDFYGVNAALLATDGANVTITNATITSSAQNGNGVFSYGEGTVVTISDSTITTTADNSGGIQTTGGGTTIASNLTVETSGSSAAAIRSDRGGGTVTVDGGTYTTNGYNSPVVYSTADITVANATLTANNSEALVIEGANSIALTDCDVTGNMSDTEGTSSDENVHNVMIYQSMSGDADVGTSTFSMTGGSLTSNNGDLIYVTNTHCILTLSGVDIVNNEEDGYLLLVAGNSGSRGWGSAGSNGAQVEFTADSQTLEGDIAVDTISTLDITLTNGSTLTGTINIVENDEGGSAVEDNAVVTIDEGCTWTLTGDCTITSLTNNGTINYNGYTITLADGTVLSE
ncbi:MAG: hypothetical protein LUC87_10380 [Clostridiales bacterium]|nr:hypothetical protein [Clostridiales bacterium]